MSLDNITGAKALAYAVTPVDTSIGIVTQAQVADIEDPINVQSDSGKKGGAAIIVVTTDGAYVLAIAQGGEPADAWILSDVTPVAITPA